jgi:hypothetical protein
MHEIRFIEGVIANLEIFRDVAPPHRAGVTLRGLADQGVIEVAQRDISILDRDRLADFACA